MPRTKRRACEEAQQSAAPAKTLPPQLAALGRPDAEHTCLADSTDVDEKSACDPWHRPGLLPADVEALATDRCRAHAELLRQHWLLLSLHWAACGSSGGGSGGLAADVWPFGHVSCAYGRGLWRHIRDCRGASCGNAMCLPTRQLTAHFCACRDSSCPLCRPVRQALSLLSRPPQHTSRRAGALRHGARACPEVARLRQLCGAVAAGEATLEEVAPTRYNLVRLVLDDMHRAAAARDCSDGGPHSPCASAASSNTMCYS